MTSKLNPDDIQAGAAAKPEPAAAEPAAPSAEGKPTNYSGLTLSNDFKLLRRLGEGGMGQVYLAEQLSLKRRVAVKLLRNELSTDEISRRRFETEAKAVAQLNHPNIVQVYAVGEQQGLLYMALEFVDGWTLKDFLQRKGPPDVPIALSIMKQVAAALTRAAEVGVIHRDIKPENILMTRKVEVKVTDFGLSRIIGQAQGLSLTQTGTAMGTPLYMSPEQVMGQPLDPRTDLYSFGATCYHLLTGQPPFTGDSAMAVGIKHVQEDPTPIKTLRPDLPNDLCLFVQRLMAKDPSDRYQTAREALRDLKKLTELILGSGSSNTGLNLAGMNSSTKLAAPTVAPKVEVAPLDETLPYVQTRRFSRTWLPWAVLASLILAICFGAFAGQYLKNGIPSIATSPLHTTPSVASQTTQSTPPSPMATPPGPVQRPPRKPRGSEPDRYERDLREKVDLTKTPPQPPRNIASGVRVRADLLHYFLSDPPHFAKATELAEDLTNSALPTYRTLGMLSHGIIAAYQNQPDKAIDWFLKALQDDQPLDFNRPIGVVAMCRLHAELNQLVQDSLEKISQKKELPPRLKRFEETLGTRRREPRLPPP